MKLALFVLVLLFSSVTLADRNIEILPDNIGENPPKSYSDQKQGNKQINDVTDSTKSKVNEALKTKSQSDAINAKLSALEHKINSHQHQLELETKALKTVKNSSEAKIKIKSSENRAKMRRIIGATTTSN